MAFFGLFGPKIPDPPILWRGNCRLCNKEITSTEFSNPKNPTCLGCYYGYTNEGKAEIERLKQIAEQAEQEKKQKESDDRQIALIKRALKEFEEETKNSG